ncbi:hypothetical protein [Pseudoalteromonas lipolytica]|uniref:Membrane protein triplicated sequence n=1 Tax=Pseudoalteromonas lipolytica TaxID=570156 RepID=A0ABY1GES2_9GAMM|nr:hypothetical protein [Pseudoalteromonas lipolytica]MBE0351942.1 hypothetical protein [Pseudoalteromonas lipolytica LMEB 39]SFT59381.1 hypothetical protein SAMN04487854_105162 [Pseudoalteromonas lipolytica]
MFLTELFGVFSLSAFVVWGMLMAFFFNVFVYTLGVKRKTTLLLSSFIMATSYMAGDFLFTWLSPVPATYLDWALYDVVTIVFLVSSYFVFKKTTPSFLYLIVGLSINTTLFLLMYLDLFIYGNTQPWFFWDIYSFGVNIVDLSMIVALIVDRDFLGLNKFKTFIHNSLKTHKLA